MAPAPHPVTRTLPDLADVPFSVVWPADDPGADALHGPPEQVSLRPADDQHWASLRYVLPVPDLGPEAEIVVKLWVNDWWPPTCPDLNLRDRGALQWIPGCADYDDAAGPAWWVAGLDYHGERGLSAHLHGTNVEVRLPDALPPDDPRTRAILSRLRLVHQGPVSWYTRAYHPHRDVPDRGSGDGLIAGLDWSPWFAAPEHPGCPAPDLVHADALPADWRLDATGARVNRRLDHAERQWVVVHAGTGNPLVWARAMPMTSQHRHPLLVRVDARYRLDWEETPLGWAGSLHADHGHHVVLLERGELRYEVWFGLHAACTRGEAAVLADRLFA